MADYIRPTPRNPILGLIADALTGGVEYMRSPQRAQQMQGLGGLLAETGIPATMERLSYGEPLTKGRGMTTRLRPEAEAALMTLGPEAVPIGRGAMAGVRATKGLPVGAATVYHGSPYRFQRFDPTKIGSGEGAQAYGYGHYVAESPAVAREYQSALSNKANEILIDGKKLRPNNYEVTQTIARFADDPVALRANLSEYVKRSEGNPYADTNSAKQALAALNAGKSVKPASTGSLYTIDLPDPAIARMVDFDKPLAQQSKEIQGLAKQYGLTDEDHMGGDLIAAMNAKRPAGAELMRQAGIPGIRYLDQGSRGAGEGTSNFVVFPGEEDLLRILSVNGGLLAP